MDAVTVLRDGRLVRTALRRPRRAGAASSPRCSAARSRSRSRTRRTPPADAPVGLSRPRSRRSRRRSRTSRSTSGPARSSASPGSSAAAAPRSRGRSSGPIAATAGEVEVDGTAGPDPHAAGRGPRGRRHAARGSQDAGPADAALDRRQHHAARTCRAQPAASSARGASGAAARRADAPRRRAREGPTAPR